MSYHCFISRAEHDAQCAEVNQFISLWLLITHLPELSPSPMNAWHCCKFLLLIFKLITPICKGSSREAETIHHTHTHTHTHTHLFVIGVWIYATAELVNSLCRCFSFPAARSPQAHRQGGNTMSRLGALKHKLDHTDILKAVPVNRGLVEPELGVTPSLFSDPDTRGWCRLLHVFSFRALQGSRTQRQGLRLPA